MSSAFASVLGIAIAACICLIIEFVRARRLERRFAESERLLRDVLSLVSDHCDCEMVLLAISVRVAQSGKE